MADKILSSVDILHRLFYCQQVFLGLESCDCLCHGAPDHQCQLFAAARRASVRVGQLWGPSPGLL